MRARIAAVAAATVMLAGCGGDADRQVRQGEQESCGAAVDAVAVAVGEAPADTTEHLRPAFESCATLAEFSEAVEDSPEVLGEHDEPEAFVRQACAEAPDLSDTPLCEAAAER